MASSLFSNKETTSCVLCFTWPELDNWTGDVVPDRVVLESRHQKNEEEMEEVHHLEGWTHRARLKFTPVSK